MDFSPHFLLILFSSIPWVQFWKGVSGLKSFRHLCLHNIHRVMYLHVGGSVGKRFHPTPILQRRALFTEGHSLFYPHSSRFNMESRSRTYWSRTSLCLVPEGSQISLPFQSVCTKSQSRMRNLGLGSLYLPTTQGFQPPQQGTRTLSESKHLELGPCFSHQITWIS